MSEDYKFSGGYHDNEKKKQEYRMLKFWSPFVTAAIIISILALLGADNKSGKSFWDAILFVSIIGRIAMAIGKAYYKRIYQIDE